MEYIYSAMLLHKAGQKVDEANVKKVLEAASVKIDEARVKALVSALDGVNIASSMFTPSKADTKALDGVNIDEAIEKAAMPVVAAPAAPIVGAGEAEKKVEDPKKKAEEEKKSGDQAAAGLGALFG